MTTLTQKYESAVNFAGKTARFKTRKVIAETACGLVETGLGHIPVAGCTLAKGIKIIKPLIINHVSGVKPESKKRGSSKHCAAEKLIEKLAYSNKHPDKTPEILIQKQTLNTILSQLLRQQQQGGINESLPYVKSLNLELLSVPETDDEKSTTANIRINISDYSDITRLLTNITSNKLYLKLAQIYVHIIPKEIQPQLNEQTDILNQIFVVLIELLFKLRDPETKDITEFNRKPGMEVGNLTLIYGSHTIQSSDTYKTKQDINFRRLLVLQELLIAKTNKMFVPMKQKINDILFLSKQQVRLLKMIVKKLLGIETQESESEEQQKEGQNSVADVAIAIKNLIVDNRDDIAKAVVKKVVKNETAEEIIDVALGSNTKFLRGLARFARKKPAFNISGLQNSGEGTLWNKFITNRNMKAAYTPDEYSTYLGFLLFNTSNTSEHEKLAITENILREYMFEDNCNTKLHISDTISSKDIETPREIINEVGIYNGKLTLEFRNGYKITIQQVGKLTNILPNLISGIFIDLLRYMVSELTNPDNELVYKLKGKLLDMPGYDAEGELCQISLLTVSNNLFPLYNMLYRTLVNLYIPINFDGLTGSEISPIIEKSLKLSSYNSEPDYFNKIWSSNSSNKTYVYKKSINKAKLTNQNIKQKTYQKSSSGKKTNNKSTLKLYRTSII